jgi:hypothetical protein
MRSLWFDTGFPSPLFLLLEHLEGNALCSGRLSLEPRRFGLGFGVFGLLHHEYPTEI